MRPSDNSALMQSTAAHRSGQGTVVYSSRMSRLTPWVIQRSTSLLAPLPIARLVNVRRES
ncbi:MAG: hypothetical protein JST54_01080 [Deltaproteobacteria bacterium]|nr:hypothetical protein [Deltaproteobacteria bacterium]